MARLNRIWPLVVDWLAILALAGVFLYAASLKIVDPGQFAADIIEFRLTPLVFVAPVALILPWLEAVAALALLWPAMRRAAALLMAGMLTAFIIGAASVMIRGLDITCGCFGPGSGEVGWSLILLDSVLLALALWLLLAGSQAVRSAAAPSEVVQ